LLSSPTPGWTPVNNDIHRRAILPTVFGDFRWYRCDGFNTVPRY
jgi:hypothetical protein